MSATFTVQDILLSSAGSNTYVSCPYALGVPEIFKKHGGTWDKFASAWSVPNDKLDGLRKRFHKIAELVAIQQAIDLADGKKPKPVTRPNIRTGAPVPVAVVGDDWISLGVLEHRSEWKAAEALGCARKSGRWFAPSQEVADLVEMDLIAIREAAAIERQRAMEAKIAAQEAVAKLQVSIDEQRAIIAPVFGERGRDWTLADLTALAQIAKVWNTARFVKLESRTLDGRGDPSVSVKTPSGVTINMTAILGKTSDDISRRVSVVSIRAPKFAKWSGFVTVATTTDNGKSYTRNLKPYELETDQTAA
jgi:hypothetical protein